MSKFYQKVMCLLISAIMTFSSLSIAYAQGNGDNAESAVELNEDADTEMTTLASSISIIKQGGDFETAYATWSKVSGAKGYKAYIKAVGGNYKQLDNSLIRNYGSYYRADAVGIRGGNYIIKIEAILDNGSITAETSAIQVLAHERYGYAFEKTSYYDGTQGIGAYDINGELKANAQVIYITEETKDKVQAEIVTSAKGATTTAVGFQNILNAIKKGYETRPFDFRLIGKITDMATMDGGDICADGGKKYKAGLTIEGIGDDTVAFGWGIRLKNIIDAEVRNIGFMDCDSSEGDDIGLQQNNQHIWIHNCDYFYGEAGGDADQKKGDGSLDCKTSTYISMSYNHFWDSGKCCLLGLKGENTTDYFITYHHNWFDHSDSRHPRIRFYTAHVFNNYYDGNAKYGIGSTLGSSVFAENNYFRNCKYPILTSMQGSDIYNITTGAYDITNMATFSKEAGGTIKAYGNYMEGQTRYVTQNTVPSGNDSKGVSHEGQIDAYEAASRNEKVPNTIKSVSGGNTYNNFDTASDFYSYKVDTPETARDKVKKYAGRVDGGDFTWTFTAEDDKSYAVNEALKSKIRSYTTSLVSVGGLSGDDVVVTTEKTSETTTNKITETTTKKSTTTTTEKQTETTTKKGTTTTTEKQTESTTSKVTETTTEATTVDDDDNGTAGINGIWDFGDKSFDKYPDRDDFVKEDYENEFNGLSIYYPAAGVVPNKAKATDGTSVSSNIKFNKITSLPSKLKNCMKIKAKKGEKIRVYVGGNAGIVMNIANGNKKNVYSSEGTATKDVTPIDYTVVSDDEYYIFFSEKTASAYMVQLLESSENDSSTTEKQSESTSESTTEKGSESSTNKQDKTTESTSESTTNKQDKTTESTSESTTDNSSSKSYNHLAGDADHDNILTASDAVIIINSILNGKSSFDNDSDMKLICDVDKNSKVNSNDAKLIMEKVLNSESVKFKAGDIVKVSKNYYK